MSVQSGLFSQLKGSCHCCIEDLTAADKNATIWACQPS